jgi:hypothetical protein
MADLTELEMDADPAIFQGQILALRMPLIERLLIGSVFELHI